MHREHPALDPLRRSSRPIPTLRVPVTVPLACPSGSDDGPTLGEALRSDLATFERCANDLESMVGGSR